jgi:hypothetical protein
VSQHVHKYRRVDIGRDTPYFVMQCKLPGCNHYTAMKTKLSCPQLLGKVSICNSCGNRFTLDRRALRLAKPICIHCVKPKNENESEKATRFFHQLKSEITEVEEKIVNDAE